MILLFDIGNTRIKWAIYHPQTAWENGNIKEYTAYPTAEDNIHRIFAELTETVQAVVVSSVASDNINLAITTVTKKHLGLAPWFAKPLPQTHGLSLIYKDLSTLGVDRWLGILAGWHSYKKAICVVDCGTAITLDIINTQGEHQGGYILPGLDLMQQTLTHHTHQLHLDPTTQPLQLQLGTDTQTCIDNGCMTAIIGLLKATMATMDSFTTSGEPPTYIFTGGDAERIVHHFDSPHHHDNTLILRGLAIAWHDNQC